MDLKKTYDTYLDIGFGRSCRDMGYLGHYTVRSSLGMSAIRAVSVFFSGKEPTGGHGGPSF